MKRATTVQTRRIGSHDVSAIGLGEMPMSVPSRPDEARSIATIHTALDAGVRLIDTANAYCLSDEEFGHGERLVAKALASYGGAADSVLVATKGGALRPDGRWEHDGRPEAIRAACEASLGRLGVDRIGLWQHHRPDPKVDYADTLGAVRGLYDDGLIEMAGISNTDVEQIQLAQQILGESLVSVQNQFSPAFRSSEDELAYCAEQGLAFLPWSPLGGISKAADLGSRFAPFQQVAQAHDVSPQQVALAWSLAKAPVVIPIPGASRPETILDSLAALDLQLSADELATLDGTGVQ